MVRASTSGASSGTQSDVPVYVWRYAKGLGEYLKMMDALECREIDLSPFLVAAAKGVKIPVTPLINPVTGFSSHFIIRMIDDDDDRYKVDCLIRDSDLYFMSFRRWRILMGWSRWYRFPEKDMILPKMFDPIKLSVMSGYSGSKFVQPGGVEAMRTMFKAFAQYPDGTVSMDSLQKACYCFMATVPESRRQRSVNRELIKRISGADKLIRISGAGELISGAGGKGSSALEEELYEGMHAWTKKGTFVLQKWLENGLQASAPSDSAQFELVASHL
ncbi:unnamed protein product [Urochloa humidicola]